MRDIQSFIAGGGPVLLAPLPDPRIEWTMAARREQGILPYRLVRGNHWMNLDISGRFCLDGAAFWTQHAV
jgi:hypothetical protein